MDLRLKCLTWISKAHEFHQNFNEYFLGIQTRKGVPVRGMAESLHVHVGWASDYIQTYIISLHDHYLSTAMIGQNGSHVSFVNSYWVLAMQYEFLHSIWISFERHDSQQLRAPAVLSLSDVCAHSRIKSFAFLNNFQKIISKQPLDSGDWFCNQKIHNKEEKLDMYIAFVRYNFGPECPKNHVCNIFLEDISVFKG